MLIIYFLMLLFSACAAPQYRPYESNTPPPSPPSGQVVILTSSCERIDTNYTSKHTNGCSFTVKNIGETDVKNVKFKLVVSGNHEDRYLESSPGIFVLYAGDNIESHKNKEAFCNHQIINYLPSKETINFKICGSIDPYSTSRIKGVAVDTFEIVAK